MPDSRPRPPLDAWDGIVIAIADFAAMVAAAVNATSAERRVARSLSIAATVARRCARCGRAGAACCSFDAKATRSVHIHRARLSPRATTLDRSIARHTPCAIARRPSSRVVEPASRTIHHQSSRHPSCTRSPRLLASPSSSRLASPRSTYRAESSGLRGRREHRRRRRRGRRRVSPPSHPSRAHPTIPAPRSIDRARSVSSRVRPDRVYWRVTTRR